MRSCRGGQAKHNVQTLISTDVMISATTVRHLPASSGLSLPAICLLVRGACNLASLWIEHPGAYMKAGSSVRNGSSFGPGRFYRSAWQWPYPIKNRRFFKQTITLRPQILIREFSVWYVKYAALHGASFGSLRLSISLNLSKR